MIKRIVHGFAPVSPVTDVLELVPYSSSKRAEAMLAPKEHPIFEEHRRLRTEAIARVLGASS